MKSPCKNKCKLEDNMCTGCKRTRKEIAMWKRMSEEEQRKVIDRINKERLSHEGE